jgi:hypothetical protein
MLELKPVHCRTAVICSANSLACARAQRVRGVAAVASGITPSDCSGAVAVLLLQNPHDRMVPLS